MHTPTLVLHEHATTWVIASLAGDLEPRCVGFKGDEKLEHMARGAFPWADVRPLVTAEDEAWADLVLVRAS